MSASNDRRRHRDVAACSNDRRRHRDVAAFFVRCSFHPGKDLIGRQHPIHRNRIATLCRTTRPQPAVATSCNRYLDLPAGDNLPADETETLVVERTPLPKLIEQL